MADTSDKSQPLAKSPSLQKQRLTFLLQAGPLLLFMVGGFVLGCWLHFQGQALLRQYEAFPNCTSTAPLSSSLPPCTRAFMKVTRKRSYHNTKSRDDYYLTLLSASGGAQEVSLLGHLLWDKSHVGDTVTVKVWKGKVMVVSAYGYHTVTDDFPEAGSQSEGFSTVMCGIGIVVVSLGMIKGWREMNKGFKTVPNIA